ncbi:hypothetical protein [Flindersiella endophytica]
MTTTVTLEPKQVWESVPGYVPQWWSRTQLDEIAERIPHLHRRSPAVAAFDMPECLFDGQPWPCRSERWRRQREANWLTSPLRIRLVRRSLIRLAALAMLCLPLLSAGGAPQQDVPARGSSARELSLPEHNSFPATAPVKTVLEQVELRHDRAAIVQLGLFRRGERS